jgi:hypothetical protein
MKVLICGECPDSLTTVARNLNRLLSEQMRSNTTIATPSITSIPALLEVPAPTRPTDLLTTDHS